LRQGEVLTNAATISHPRVETTYLILKHCQLHLVDTESRDVVFSLPSSPTERKYCGLYHHRTLPLQHTIEIVSISRSGSVSPRDDSVWRRTFPVSRSVFESQMDFVVVPNNACFFSNGITCVYCIIGGEFGCNPAISAVAWWSYGIKQKLREGREALTQFFLPNDEGDDAAAADDDDDSEGLLSEVYAKAKQAWEYIAVNSFS
jgi:hypothetical protein